jgi:LPS sulfotransferase NodH
MEMRKFVVVGVQRSGTTLVTTSLDSHPDVCCAGELFKMRRPRRGVDVRDGGYRSYINSALHLKIADRLVRPCLVRHYLDRFFAQSSFRAIGFKLMRNHLHPGQFPMVTPYLIERQTSVIHIVRENVLKTYISRLMAQRSGRFHTTDKRAASSGIEVPVRDLVRKLSGIAEQNMQLTQTFGGSVPYIACTYEQYSADPEIQGRRLLAFLGLRATELHTPLVKLTSDDLSRTVENLDAVKRCLHSTEFEKWI